VTILIDKDLFKVVTGSSAENPMIDPFIPELVSEDGLPSYGLSSCGYDIRLSNEIGRWCLPTSVPLYDGTPRSNISHELTLLKYKVDLKDKSETNKLANIIKIDAPYYDIKPGHFILGTSVEKFNMPDDVIAQVTDKSSWARCGIAVQNTIIEPGWTNANLTLEITNHNSFPVRLYFNNCGIAQIIFHRLSDKPSTVYRERKGKYQNQVGVTFPL